MASNCKGKKPGTREIRLSPGETIDGTRPKIALGKCNKRQADTVRVHIENLVSARQLQTSIVQETVDWVADLDGSLRSRLEALRLIEPRKGVGIPTISEWVGRYIAGRTDVRPNTMLNYKKTAKDLVSFFGTNRRLDTITQGDADAFAIQLKGRLAQGTANRRIGRAKQFLRAAVKHKLIGENPFAELKSGDSTNPEKFYFVTREEIDAILDNCPDMQWRLIFTLARYVGLRCPSELLLLRWSDVNWEKMRLTIRSPKTEHQGKASRVCPIFPEVAPVLWEAYEQAQPGETYLVTSYRDSKQNLRTHATRIIRRAGLNVWPKLFVNMRSSRETELVEEYPVHVVTAWIGNSPEIARKHYLQTTEEHFQRAINTPSENPCPRGDRKGDTKRDRQRLNDFARKRHPGQVENISDDSVKNWQRKSPNVLQRQGLRMPGTGVEPARGINPTRPSKYIDKK